jgi:regulatory protein
VNKTDSEALRKAKAYAFLLLKYRQRSEHEIRQRLKRKRFDEVCIAATVIFLKEKGFLNDAEFVKSWVESRLKRTQGLLRIKAELKLKGIDNRLIDKTFEELKGHYSEEEVVSSIARERLTKGSQSTEPHIAKRRIFSYLVRRGFSPEIIADVLEQL